MDHSDDALDRFPGSETLATLSETLMSTWHATIPDETVAAALGAECVAAFRYAATKLHGRRRKITKEPTICHSADIALRAADLEYPPHVRVVGLLHDLVEDRADDVPDAHALLDEIAGLFGADVARDVALLTNVYHLVLDGVEDHLPTWLPFVPASLDRALSALDEQRAALAPNCRATFERVYARLAGFLATGLDLSAEAAEAEQLTGYSLYRALRRRTYALYLEDMADDAAERAPAAPTRLYEPVVVVKSLDMVDNLRTSDVGAYVSLEKILGKGELLLDKTFYLHDVVHRAQASARSTFLPLYDVVKYNLVEQLFERQHALSFLADTRFRAVTRYLSAQVARLQDKYHVAVDRIAELVFLRREIRARNTTAAR
jgi:hypothetical protein